MQPGGQEEARKSSGDGLSSAELVTKVEKESRHWHLTQDGPSGGTDADEPSTTTTVHPDISTDR